MINHETHTIDWILNLKSKLGRSIDPKLIEKVIWALTLLEHLKINGLKFTFKGGPAFLLATEKPKRSYIANEHKTKQTTIIVSKTLMLQSDNSKLITKAQ